MASPYRLMGIEETEKRRRTYFVLQGLSVRDEEGVTLTAGDQEIRRPGNQGIRESGDQEIRNK